MTKELEKLFGIVDGESQDSVIGKLAILAEEIAIEDDAIATIDAGLKERKKKLDERKGFLAMQMAQAQMPSFTTDNGLAPRQRAVVKFYRVSGKTEDDVLDWLKQNELAGVIKRTVPFNTLQATLKEFEELHGETAIPEELFSKSVTQTVTLGNKSKFISKRKGVDGNK